jgi:hypothetical protein
VKWAETVKKKRDLMRVFSFVVGCERTAKKRSERDRELMHQLTGKA